MRMCIDRLKTKRNLGRGIAVAFFLIAFVLLLKVKVNAEEYFYDDLDRLTKVVYEDGSFIEYSYDANGNLLEIKVQKAEPTTTPKPTMAPTVRSTSKPTTAPEAKPTAKPTPVVTTVPTTKPTVKPTATPKATVKPTVKPTATPKVTVKPTMKPTATPKATAKPTVKPTATPKATVKPTIKPTIRPTATPKASAKPTATAKPDSEHSMEAKLKDIKTFFSLVNFNVPKVLEPIFYQYDLLSKIMKEFFLLDSFPFWK